MTGTADGTENRVAPENAIRFGIEAEADWEGPSIKPGVLFDDEIAWLASWLDGEGFRK